jgi:polar amino acid transport system substrate-binding protein
MLRSPERADRDCWPSILEVRARVVLSDECTWIVNASRAMGENMLLRSVCGILGALILLATPLHPASAESTLEKVKQAGTLKVCFAQQQPDNYKDPKTNEWTGVMADLLKELSKWMKVQVEIVEVGWDVAVLSLKQGTCDLFASSIVYTAPRAMEVAFVTPFGAKGDNVVIDKRNPKGIKTHADLNNSNVTLVAELGTREQENAQRFFPKAKILAVKVPSTVQIIDWVKRGDADAAVLPTITTRWWLNVPENAAWGAMGFPDNDFGNAPNGWAVRQGDPDWLNFLNSYVSWVSANGMAKQLYGEYLERTNPFAKKE